MKFVLNDHVRVGKLEDRLKQWHAQMGDDAKTQIRPLSRYVSRFSSLQRIGSLDVPVYSIVEYGSFGYDQWHGNVTVEYVRFSIERQLSIVQV